MIVPRVTFLRSEPDGKKAGVGGFVPTVARRACLADILCLDLEALVGLGGTDWMIGWPSMQQQDCPQSFG